MNKAKLKSRYMFHHRVLHAGFFVALLCAAAIGTLALAAYASEKVTVFSLSISSAEQVSSSAPVSVARGGSGPSRYLSYLAPTNKDEDLQAPEEMPQPQAVADRSYETGSNLIVDFFILQNNQTVISRNLFFSNESAVSVPVISDPTPLFRGTVNIPGALIFLELHSTPHAALTASINANSSGQWSWQPTKKIETGLHTLYMFIFDPLGEKKLGSAAYIFEYIPLEDISNESIVTGENIYQDEKNVKVIPRTDIILPPSLMEERKVLFDIRTEIIGTPAPHEIHPGDSILLQVSLLNIGSPGHIIDTDVEYRFYNKKGEIIFQEKETVGVSTQTSYIKTFRTKPTLQEGEYRIEASVAYDDTEAMAYDSVKVQGAPVIVLGAKTQLNVTFIFQLLVMIGAISVLVMYFEVKQAESLRKMLHQVTEEDFIQKHLIH